MAETPLDRLAPWERELPRVLVPPHGTAYLPVSLDVKRAFPPNTASRWVLGLLAARNDLSIALKLIAPFMVNPSSRNKAEALYITSHLTYLWRLLVAQAQESWIIFNRGRSSQDELIKQVCGSQKVKDRLKTVLASFEVKVDGQYSLGTFLERCRASTFHYYDEDGDEWGKQLEHIQSEPFFVVPQEEKRKQVSARYITADEWINSRLNGVGFGSNEFQKDVLLPAVAGIARLLDGCAYTYLAILKIELRTDDSNERLWPEGENDAANSKSTSYQHSHEPAS